MKTKQTKAERIYEMTKAAIMDDVRYNFDDREHSLDYDARGRMEGGESIYTRTRNAILDLIGKDIRRLEQKARHNEKYCDGETRDFMRREYAIELEAIRRTYNTITTCYVF